MIYDVSSVKFCKTLTNALTAEPPENTAIDRELDIGDIAPAQCGRAECGTDKKLGVGADITPRRQDFVCYWSKGARHRILSDEEAKGSALRAERTETDVA